jgi:predicted Zn-dependent protease
MNKKWLTFWLGALVVLVALQGCGDTFDSWIISAADERAMGDTFNMMVEDKNPDLLKTGESLLVAKTAGQKAFYNYYDSLGKLVIKQISDDDLEDLLPDGYSKAESFFTFQIIQSDQVNAFAVPGGYVYFYTSIFKSFKNEAELVGVLAHEVGHIVLHHSREAMVDNALGSAVIDAVLGDGNLVGTLGDLGWGLAGLAGSRDNEYEADSMGVYYASQAKIAATGIQSFFSEGVEWTINSSGDTTGCEDATFASGVFSTHPPSCARIEKAKERFEALTAAQRAYSNNAAKYQEMVKAASF